MQLNISAAKLHSGTDLSRCLKSLLKSLPISQFYSSLYHLHSLAGSIGEPKHLSAYILTQGDFLQQFQQTSLYCHAGLAYCRRSSLAKGLQCINWSGLGPMPSPGPEDERNSTFIVDLGIKSIERVAFQGRFSY